MVVRPACYRMIITPALEWAVLFLAAVWVSASICFACLCHRLSALCSVYGVARVGVISQYSCFGLRFRKHCRSECQGRDLLSVPPLAHVTGIFSFCSVCICINDSSCLSSSQAVPLVSGFRHSLSFLHC